MVRIILFYEKYGKAITINTSLTESKSASGMLEKSPAIYGSIISKWYQYGALYNVAMEFTDYQDLLDYRRIVAENYAHLRSSELGMQARWRQFQDQRDALIGGHAQSALDQAQRAEFSQLQYFDYDPGWRYLVKLDTDVDREVIEVPLQDDGVFKMKRFGRVTFAVEQVEASLDVYWVMGYGGGVFLPFRDGTNQTGETYGGGRYLLDSIKGADLGMQDGKMVLDFNYAYNPSCAYNPRWHCPLAPQENWLEVAIPAGEKVYIA